MTPLKLIIKDFGPYDDAEINFEEFQLALIIGKINNNEFSSNGSGKSTIFNAIKYVLFGESDSNLKEIIRQGAQQASVSFICLDDNNEKYKITRSRALKGGSSLVIQKEESDLSWKDLSQRRSSQDTEKELEKLLKINYKTFYNSLLFSQNDFVSLATLTAEKRKGLLKSILDLHQYQKYELSAKKMQADYNKIIDKNKTLIGVLNNPEEEIKNLSDSLIKLSNDKVLLDKNFSLIQKELDNLVLSYKEKENQINEVKNQKALILSIEKDLNDLKNKENNLKSKIEAINAEKLNISKTINSIKLEIKEKENSYNNITDNFNDIQSIQEELSTIKAEGLSLNKEKELLKDVPDKSLCDSCLQEIPHSHKENINEKNKQKLESINKTVLSLKEKYVNLDKKLNTLVKNKSIKETLEKEIFSLKERIKTGASQLSSKDDYLNSLNLEIKSINDTIVLKTKEKKSIKIDESADQKIEILNKIAADINTKNISKKNIENSILDLEKRKSVLEHSLDSSKINLEKLNVLKEEQTKLNYKNTICLDVINAFSSKGIPALIIQSILEDLQQRVNNYLDTFKPGLQMLFSLIKENTAGDQEDTLEIKYLLNGAEREYTQLSGAQKWLITMAFKLSIAEINYNRANCYFPLLLLDEVDQSLDKSSIDVFTDVVRELQKKFKILIITHNDYLKAKFNNIIQVEQDQFGVSKINQL